jgi:hypothetical protein
LKQGGDRAAFGGTTSVHALHDHRRAADIHWQGAQEASVWGELRRVVDRAERVKSRERLRKRSWGGGI